MSKKAFEELREREEEQEQDDCPDECVNCDNLSRNFICLDLEETETQSLKDFCKTLKY